MANEEKFPNIKLNLNSNSQSRKIDIGIYQKKNSIFKYVHFVSDVLSKNPFILPVFFLLYRLLDSFHLIPSIKSGLKTYGIFLMVYLVTQIHPPTSIAELFLNVVEYYRTDFPYDKVKNEEG